MTITLASLRMCVVLLLTITVVLLWCCDFAAAATEPRTGIRFPDKLQRHQSLSKLGVRTKGPFKVYAVGQYGDHAFLLQMAMNVGGTKISSALAEALKPRCQQALCGSRDIGDFEALLLSGLPNGAAAKGTKLLFGTGNGKLTISVNDKSIGTISSKALAKAFANIYTDKNAVCQLKSINVTEKESSVEEDRTESIIIAISVVAVTCLLLWIYNQTRQKKAVVCELYIYPIKSCAAQPLETAIPTARGFRGDRIAQVTDSANKYCTPREADKVKLFHVQPKLVDNNGTLYLTVTSPYVKHPLQLDLTSSTESPRTTVMAHVLEAPNKLPLEDFGSPAAAWMQEATAISGCRLTGTGDAFDRNVRVNLDQRESIPTINGVAPVSLADEAPYLLCSTASLADLNRRLQQRGQGPVDMRRFRPNIVIQGFKPWEEDSFSRIRIGSVDFHVWQRCGRCVMTTIDRDTLERGPEPLATLSTFRERANGMRNFGMHLIPVKRNLELGENDEEEKEVARISIGDSVKILEYDLERRSEWERLFGK